LQATFQAAKQLSQTHGTGQNKYLEKVANL